MKTGMKTFWLLLSIFVSFSEEVGRNDCVGFKSTWLMGNPNPNRPTATLSKARKNVECQKYHFGNGISTLIIIHNDMDEDLVFTDEYSEHGEWYWSPVQWLSRDYKIPAHHYGSLLHTKSSASLYGSEGWLKFTTEDDENVYFQFNTPYWGTNHIGATVCPKDWYADNYFINYTNNRREIRTSGHKIIVTAEFLRDVSSPHVKFTIKKENYSGSSSRITKAKNNCCTWKDITQAC